jgi:HAE1 family hydrophobic/amphiphilic exporter-1
VRDATVYVKLSEKAERKRSQKDIQQVIRRGLQEIPGIIPSIMEVGRLDNQKPLQINIRGDNIDLLKRYAADLKQRIQGIRGIADMEVTMEHDIPEFRFTVNRELAASTGVMTGDIVRTVGALVGGQVVSTYEDEDGDAVNLRVRLPLALRQEPEQIGRLKHTVRSLDGSPVLVPLSSLISCQRSATPAEINR